MNNYLAILDETTAAGPVTRTISIVDFSSTPLVERSIYRGLANGSQIGLPVLQYSQVTGTAFLIYNPTGNDIQGLAIYRSDTGDLLCAGPPSLVPTGQIIGEATATQLKIHYGSAEVDCPKP